MARIILILLLITPFILNAQNDSVVTPEVVVTGDRQPAVYSEVSRVIAIIDQEQIKNAPVQNLNDLLEYVVTTDVRQRGSKGVQADISIRGGNYEQALILINGIKVNDPQTGHHNLNIPIDIESIQRIEILEGPGARIFGPNAFTGAVNIITGTDEDRNIQAHISGGEYNFYKTSLNTSYKAGPVNNYLSISKSGSNGYIENTDFQNLNLFYQLKINEDFGEFDAQAGYLNRGFGANSFYTPDFPNQFEQINTYFAAVQYKTGKDLVILPRLYWRRNHDRFELFRNFYNADDWYTGHNYHQSDAYGAELNLSYYSKFGVTALGGEYRREEILSNVLGEPLDEPVKVPGENNAEFTKSKGRNNINLFLDHSLYLDKFSASAGLLAYWNDDFGFNLFPGVDLSYELMENLRIYGSFNQTLRLPTFTELYYSDPVSEGNPDLKPEEATSFEGGFKYINRFMSGHISIFRRAGKNIIDFIQFPEEIKWKAANLTEVNTTGMEIAIKLNPKQIFFDDFPVNYVSLSYGYLDNDNQEAGFISEYVLDYLKHKLVFGLEHEIYWGFGASWKLNFQDRSGEYIDFVTKKVNPYEPFLLFDGKLFWKNDLLTAYVEVSNILNEHYFDISNVRMPGRWLIGGVKLNLDF